MSVKVSQNEPIHGEVVTVFVKGKMKSKFNIINGAA